MVIIVVIRENIRTSGYFVLILRDLVQKSMFWPQIVTKSCVTLVKQSILYTYAY